MIATIGGKNQLEDRLIIRPTSEVLFCEHYAKIISSYRDLPKKYNQWCSVVRWEKTTRPFLRGSEFLWQEGHTVHATEEEARFETLRMLEIYDNLGKELLATPFMTGRKTEKEKFAGAKESAIKELFDMTPPAYYQLLNNLIDRDDALLASPMLVKRLRRLREARTNARSL